MPLRQYPVSEVPVLSSVTNPRHGFSSVTLTLTSIWSSDAPPRKTTVVSLLGHQHLDDAVAAITVILFDRLQCTLYIREILVLPGVGRDDALQVLCRQQ